MPVIILKGKDFFDWKDNYWATIIWSPVGIVLNFTGMNSYEEDLG
jgi:hypothetical protein